MVNFSENLPHIVQASACIGFIIVLNFLCLMMANDSLECRLRDSLQGGFQLSFFVIYSAAPLKRDTKGKSFSKCRKRTKKAEPTSSFIALGVRRPWWTSDPPLQKWPLLLTIWSFRALKVKKTSTTGFIRIAWDFINKGWQSLCQLHTNIDFSLVYRCPPF